MALTEAQRASVRLYMGWSARFHQTDNALEQALLAVDGDAEVETQITGILAELATIETALTAAHQRLQAQSYGSINLPLGGEIGMLRGRGREKAGRLAIILGVEQREDAFAPALVSSRQGTYGRRSVGGGSNYLRSG